MISINATKRTIGENLEKLLKNGSIPAVFYGRKEDSTPIAISLSDFLKVWKEAGESSVVTIKMKGQEDLEALVHDVDLDPVTDVPRHADFYVFEKGKKIKVNIPIEFTGVAPAVKDLGGILIKVRHEVEVEALPKDLPHKLVVNVSSLVNFENQIFLRDVVLPDGASFPDGTNPNDVVALVSEAKEEVVEETAPVDLSTIEVEKKGKKEEGSEIEQAEAPKADKENEAKK